MTHSLNLNHESNESDESTNIEYGSHNVFADLGLENADELYIRAQLGMLVFSLLKKRGYKQTEASRVLGIAQSEVSALCSGKFNRFSQERLISFLNKLDWKVTFTLSPRHQDEPSQSVTVLS